MKGVLNFVLCLFLSFWEGFTNIIVGSDRYAVIFTQWVGLIGAILMALKVGYELRVSFFSSTKRRNQ